MNRGNFRGKDYYKVVNLNKAVLWKDRQLSLPKFIILGFNAYKTNKAIFIDRGKGEKWIFNVDKILDKGEWKMVGQEEQLYFPIELAKRVKLKGNDDKRGK